MRLYSADYAICPHADSSNYPPALSAKPKSPSATFYLFFETTSDGPPSTSTKYGSRDGVSPREQGNISPASARPATIAPIDVRCRVFPTFQSMKVKRNSTCGGWLSAATDGTFFNISRIYFSRSQVSMCAAARRPWSMARTTNDAPVIESPAANMPGTEVM